VVTLSDDSGTLVVPPSVTVAAGTTSAGFSAAVGALAANETAVVTASANSILRTSSLSLVAGRNPTSVFRDASGGIRLSRQGSTTLYSAGGVFAGDPAGAQNANGDTFTVARDPTNALWGNVFNASTLTWGSWRYAAGTITGVPAIAVATNGVAYVAVRDASNAYWLVSFAAQGAFSPWVYLAGSFTTDPVIAACPDGSIYIVGRDSWRSLWSGRFTPSFGWEGWRYGAGIIQGKPSAACGTDNVVYVSIRDDWNGIWMARVQNATWLGWSYGGGVLGSDPQAVTGGDGNVYAVLRDTGGGVWYRGYTQGTTNGWLSWTMTGGVLQDFSAAGLGGGAYVSGRDPGNNLWWYNPVGSRWTNLGYTGLAAGPVSASPR
jgi:hypothetical protein